jgi:flagellar assembly protein FliH
MPLSKVLHTTDCQSLKRVRFGGFDETNAAPAEMVFEDMAIPVHPATEAEPPPAAVEEAGAREPVSAPAADLQAELEEAYRRGQDEALQELEGSLQQQREALQKKEQELHSAADMLGRSLEEVSLLRESLLHNSSQDMLRLVMSISKQVIHREVSLDKEVVLATIDRALRSAVRCDSYHLRVNPSDLALVTERKPLFEASINGLRNLTLEADPAIEPGGCLLESQLGEVDATIDGQLEAIRRILHAATEEP